MLVSSVDEYSIQLREGMQMGTPLVIACAHRSLDYQQGFASARDIRGTRLLATAFEQKKVRCSLSTSS